mgnify:CR=1 FL=1
MTDEQAGSAEDLAKAKHIIEWWTTQLDHGMDVHGDDLQTLTRGIARALAARERVVFEKIAQKAFDESRNYIGRDFGKGDVLSNFARWVRQQAEEGR